MILLATDLDRTLLPNGPAPDDGGIEALFSLLKTVPHLLVYVTGRNLNLVYDAQKMYGIPTPDYLIAEVGTSMFRKNGDTLVPEARWISYVRSQERGWDSRSITDAIGNTHDLKLQENSNQNQFKISYYLANHNEKDAAFAHIHETLTKFNIDADVLWSIDPLKNNIGLIDVLPKTATKATALEFLRRQEHFEKEDVIYCGDSGNDILPLTRCYRSILVKNAPEDVKKEVTRRTNEQECPNTLYIATGTQQGNGNYSSGILEGLHHFNIAS